MKALTIKQPWASLIIRGGKDIENRDWPTRFRGIVAIHSSAKLDQHEVDSACDLMAGFVRRFSEKIFRADSFPTGSILGVVEIVDCVSASTSPWFVGNHGFVLRNPVAFEHPIPCRGALGFWNMPDDLTQRAREQYRTAMRGHSNEGE